MHTYLYRAVHAHENVYVHIYTKVYAIMYCTLIKLKYVFVLMYILCTHLRAFVHVAFLCTCNIKVKDMHLHSICMHDVPMYMNLCTHVHFVPTYILKRQS